MAGSIRGLYVIIDPSLCSGRDPVDVARNALDGGASAIQWRDKSRALGDQLDDALAIAALCSKQGALFIVNDHVDLALACDADGVHLGQHDLPIERVRPIAGDGIIIGVSTNNVAEARRAEALGANYVAVGAIFETASKSDTRPANLARLSEIKGAVTIPVIAIGGINTTNISDVVSAGADGAAVISAVCAASDVKAAATELAATFKPASTTPRRARMLLLADAYIRAINGRDLPGFLELFASDGVLEDPLSDPPHIGHEAIGRWWSETGISHRPFAISVGTLAITGMEMALVWSIQHEHAGHQPALATGVEIISVNDQWQISSVHSLWDRPNLALGRDAQRLAASFVDAINTRDREAYLSLWSNEGILQDPVSRSPLIGIDSIMVLWDMMDAASDDYSLLIDSVCVGKDEVGIAWTTVQHRDQTSRTFHGVHILTLTAHGTIGAQHSYWEPDNLPAFE